MTYPRKPDAMIQYNALAFRCCGIGSPVKQNRAMFNQINAKKIAIVFNESEPIRLLDTSGERDDTVHITEAHKAHISPRTIINKYLQREYNYFKKRLVRILLLNNINYSK